jgi:hypothetical protein
MRVIKFRNSKNYDTIAILLLTYLIKSYCKTLIHFHL